MGFFGYKESEVEDSLRRSTRAVLIGGIFHTDHAEQFKLNKEATAYIYTEMLSNLIYCIGIVYQNKILGKKSWATTKFLENCIKKEIESYERQFCQTTGSITSIIFKRLYEIERMSPQQRANLEHIRESASKIKSIDSNADMNLLEKTYEVKTREFIKILIDRF